MSVITNFFIQQKEWILPLVGAFGGAFFAFCFFILGERWRLKKEWRKKVINEHAYLDRYLQFIRITLDKNIKKFNLIKNHYKEKQLSLVRLVNFPIREDASMRLKDMDYLNNVENFINRLKELNLDIITFNTFINDINDDIKNFIIDKQRKDLQSIISTSINLFLEDSDTIINFQKMLKDDLDLLYAQNMVLYDYYKSNIFKKMLWNINKKINKDFMESKVNLRMDEFVQEIEKSVTKNKEKLEKYNIIKKEL
ncbi:MAG: hypothetical protein GF365_00810 [Candidatus Buchananbacteria bacterium]|nr:hypothetical protein [Candidatus Buchananbacteria bacterium]